MPLLLSLLKMVLFARWSESLDDKCFVNLDVLMQDACPALSMTLQIQWDFAFACDQVHCHMIWWSLPSTTVVSILQFSAYMSLRRGKTPVKNLDFFRFIYTILGLFVSRKMPPERHPIIVNSIMQNQYLICTFYASLLGYVTFSVGMNSSLMALILTNRESSVALPALSFVPLALDPPKGCCPTTAPVHLQLM